jgi:hypothetical protein
MVDGIVRVLWPMAVSYAVSYLFIAIIWINHHYLWQFVGPSTLGLIWINFVRPSLHGVAAAFCDRMGCAHPARVVPCSVLRQAICAASTSPIT